MRLGLRGKLLIAGLVVLAAAVLVSVLLVRSAGGQLHDQAFTQLRSVRESKAAQIEAEVAQFLANLDTLAHARSTVNGLPQLSEAFHELDEPVDQEALNGYYDQEFVSRVAGAIPLSQVIARGLQPDEVTGRRLQDLYIANNDFPVGSKDRLRDARDGSAYSSLHAQVHPMYQSALRNSGAYDIFLIDLEGDIVYSVFKEIDVGTNLATGGHSTTGLAEAWQRSVDTGAPVVTDFAPYLPSYNQPAAFAAQTVYDDGGEPVGTIAMQAPIDRINAVMTSNERWSDVGLGDTGETYIVAEDGTMRNDSRFLIEDREGYFRAILNAGVSNEVVQLIDTFDSTVGLQEVDTEGTRDALAGNTGEQIFPDYRGVDVFSSYQPLLLGDSGLSWVIMSEIDAAEALAAQDTLERTALVSLSVTGLLLLVAIVVASGRITRPIRLLEAETSSIAAFDFVGDSYDTTAIDHIGERRDELGDLATSFAQMTETLRENVRSRVAVESELDVASGIQRSMLPLTFPTRPKITEFELFADLIPAKEVGGDFYDFGSIDNDQFFFVVGDVSGKGVPAALFMAATKTLIRSGAMAGEPPAELLTRINAEIAESNPECMFATVWLAVLDLRTGKVTFTNAGHNPPLIVNDEGARFVTDRHGPFLGPVPGITYSSGEIVLGPGDRLIVYSDGVTEAMDPDDQLFGEDRLTRSAIEGRGLDVDDATTALIRQVLRWEQGTRSDDVTVLHLSFLSTRDVPQFRIRLDPSQMMEEVGRLNAGVAAFTREQEIPDETVSKLQIVLDEVLTNVAQHAEAEFVTIDLWLSESMVRLTVTDDGQPFNPLAQAPPDTSLGLHDRQIGGLGIHLVHSLMPEIEYRYVNGQNVLAMTMEV